MDFSHYSGKPVCLAVDLINTQQSDGDEISSSEEFVAFLSGYDELWEGAAQPFRAENLPRIHELREALRSVIEAPDVEAASVRINTILDEYGAVPRVSLHSGQPHLHFEPPGQTMTEWLGTITAMGLASVIVEHGVERFGVCESDSCSDAFVDTSRNRSRRHCSNTCSTREAVAAYRQRQSA